MKKIQEIFPDLELDEVETGSYSAEDLEQAIECYIQYGEYDIDSLWKELNDAYNNESNAVFIDRNEVVLGVKRR